MADPKKKKKKKTRTANATTAAPKKESKAVSKTKPKKAAPKKAKASKEAEEVKIQEQYQKWINEIVEECDAFLEDLKKADRFKAAARRARKKSSELGQKFKDFRRASIDLDKMKEGKAE